MKLPTYQLFKTGTLAGVLTLLMGGVASAHVVVKPAEVLTAGFTTFTMGVPNERAVPTTSVKLDIPAGLKTVSPTQKAGWQITVTKNGTGEDAVTSSITWSGGTVGVGFRDDFTFSAQAPAQPTELHWKAYQTYADGTIVSWDQAGNKEADSGTTGPFSVTKVVATTETDAAIAKADQAAADAKDAANWSLYLGVISLVVALIALFLATRQRGIVTNEKQP